MTTLDLQRLAESLTGVQFETLLRLRMKTAFANCQSPPGLIMLVASPEYGKTNELKNCEWHIGHHGEQTKGEILDDCVVEFNRRRGFEQSNKLNLIEAAPAVEIEPISEEEADPEQIDDPNLPLKAQLDSDIPF